MAVSQFVGDDMSLRGTQLGSGEHSFPKISAMLKASPLVLNKEVKCIESLVSLKANRGIDARRDVNTFTMDMIPWITSVGKLQVRLPRRSLFQIPFHLLYS